MAFRTSVLLTGGILVCLSGCKPPAAPPPRAMPAPEVAVARPIAAVVQETVEYPATTTALETVDVRPRVTGFLMKMHFTPQEKVDRDQPLFLIDERPFLDALEAAKARLTNAEAMFASAEFDARKTGGLYKSGSASEQEFVDAQSKLDQVNAQIALAKADVAVAQLNYDWTKVRAPIHGRVTRNLVDIGNIVSADQTILATITNDDALYAYFNLSEQDVLRILARQRAAAESAPAAAPDPQTVRGAAVALALMNESEFPHAGVVDYVAPSVDPNTGTRQMRARFDNAAGRLLPGVFGRMRIPIGDPHPALLISDRALGQDQGQRFVLVVNDKNVVEQHTVRIGAMHDGRRAVLAGLSPDDRIIVIGLQRVRPGVTVKPNEVAMPSALAEPEPPRTASQPAASTSAPAAH